MKINWTEIGAEYSTGEHAREKIIGAYNKMEWLELKDKPTMGFMQGNGIKAAIKEFRIPAFAVADSFELAPYGLYGIKANYKDNNRVDILVIDSGDSITPVCANEI